MTERQRVASGSPYEPTTGFCRAMRVGDRLLDPRWKVEIEAEGILD